MIRVGLATDIELIDGYPEKYSSYIMRQHRWVRGDWQLIRWLSGKYGESISSLSKWKILDNYKKKLVAYIFTNDHIFGFDIFPWKYFCLDRISTDRFTITYNNNGNRGFVVQKIKIQKMKLNGNIIYGYKTHLYQGLLTFMFLPHEGLMMVDAIVRTLYRVLVSKKNLLEWTTAFDMERKLGNSITCYFNLMRGNFLISLALVILTYIFNTPNVLIGLIVGLLWSLGPMVAYEVSKEEVETTEKRQEDLELLKEIGEKTWKFYKTL